MATPKKPATPTPAATVAKPREVPSFRTLNETVTVLVGEAKTPFPMHKGFLVHYSKYFEKCLKGDFVEATTGVVTLDHTDPDVFALFMEWVYTQSTVIKPSEITTGPEKLRGETPTFDQLAKAWILTDYLQAPLLQNRMSNIIIAKANRLCWVEFDVNFLYKHTTALMPLRKLFVELFCGVARRPMLRQHLATWPQEALVDFGVIRSERPTPAYNLPGEDSVMLRSRHKEFHVPVDYS